MEERLTEDLNNTNYLEYMINVAVLFGADRTRAQNEMTEVLEFERNMIKVWVHPKVVPKKNTEFSRTSCPPF